MSDDINASVTMIHPYINLICLPIKHKLFFIEIKLINSLENYIWKAFWNMKQKRVTI